MWGAWVAQLVKCPTLDFGSGHDLTVCGIEPYVCLHTDDARSTSDSLSLCPPLLMVSHKINEHLEKEVYPAIECPLEIVSL